MKNTADFPKKVLKKITSRFMDSAEIEAENVYHVPLLFPSYKNPGFFDLSSHERAEKAMDFAIKMRNHQFHVLVIGENRSGRMSATLAYLENQVKSMPRPNDWIYLNNFTKTYKPIPFELPNGQGNYLKKKLAELILQINILINRLLNSGTYLNVVETLNAQIQINIDNDFRSLSELATQKGLKIEQTPEGFNVEPISEDANITIEDLTLIRERLNQVTLNASLASQQLSKTINEFREKNLTKALHPLFEKFRKKFGDFLKDWIDLLESDVIHNIDLFLNTEEMGSPNNAKEITDRYAVNVLVDNTYEKHPRVFLESNPTFETIFGSIQYLTNPTLGIVDTNFTMIKPGALHMANGGFLVLRAEDMIKDIDLWNALKSALRDKRIRLYEKHRENTLPILDAPVPKSIPLDVQVFLIVSPFVYYNFLYNDMDIETYFKIKAEIDSDMPANDRNIRAYEKLMIHFVKQNYKCTITKSAIRKLLDLSSRLVENKKKLSSQFEIILEVIQQASVLKNSKNKIDAHSIQKVLDLRHKRHSRIEEKSIQDILEKLILIDIEDKKIGQINGLTVISIGDHEFGMPSRISAQTYMGKNGIVNIERLTEMAGPTQQKGALIIEGFLNGLFGQDFPLHYGCTLTFEQTYGEVDGDSASMAELLAILSSLGKWPIRQDIAITGSLNQFGQAQAVGGVYAKIEGFYKLCETKGLTGTQGVILPISNIDHLTVHEKILESCSSHKFHLYPVRSIFEAINIIFDQNILLKNGFLDENESILEIPFFRKIYDQLKHFYKMQQK
jgi:predicted ATP-dependent protease